MISSKFYAQTYVCPICRGWGTKEFPPVKVGESCSECGGMGVLFPQSEAIYVWNAPALTDYKKRKRVLIFKLLTIIVVLISLMFVYLKVRSLLTNIV